MRAYKSNNGVAEIEGRMIRFGVKGMADITVLVHCHDGHGQAVFVEVKTGSGRPSKPQKAFARMVNSLGFPYFIAREIQATLEFLDRVAAR